jgi:Zn-dependent metalloprotease
MKIKSLAIMKMKRIIVILRRQMGVWCLSIALVTPTMLHAQTNSISQQPGRRFPTVERTTPLAPNQRQSPPEPTRYTAGDDGYLRYLGAPPSYHFPVGSAVSGQPEVTARNFLREQATLFGVTSAAVDFGHLKTNRANNRRYVRLNQMYAGIPVFSARVMIQLNSVDGVECVMSDIERNMKDLDDGTLSIKPLISAEEASVKARNSFVTTAPGVELRTTPPRLTIYAPSVVGDKGSIRLVWDMEVSSEDTMVVNQRVLLDAHNGNVVRQYPLNHSALNRKIFDANNSTSDPGTLVRSEGGGPSGNTDVDKAFNFLGDAFVFYRDNLGRDSIDGSGMTLSATVRFCPPKESCPWRNSKWNGSRMYFGAGWAVDDLTGHELTHGVTQFESGLNYANDSGAMNESFSDIFGEFIDLLNGQGNDTATVRWQVGEELPNGTLRNMRNPPAFGDPDRLGSPLFIPNVDHPDDTNDHGGVHTNSGVNNKLCYLLTDGDVFNSQTVSGMGILRVASLYYEVNTNLLTSGADWTDLYNALVQAAINLGWDTQERNNLFRACAAVEIASPQDIYVDLANFCSLQNGRQFCILNLGGPFRKVINGVNAARPGDALFIRSGSYNETLTFDKIMVIKSYDGIVTIGQP